MDMMRSSCFLIDAVVLMKVTGVIWREDYGPCSLSNSQRETRSVRVWARFE